LSQEDLASLEDNTNGQFSGIGVDITLVDGLIKVIAPIDDAPAQRAGIQAGDWIIKIDGHSTKGLDSIGIAKLMRGKPGTPITLSVMRGDLNEQLHMTMKRAIIQQHSVRSKLLQEQFGYLRITHFQNQTGVDLRNHMRDLQDGADVVGWIIDLRNNPGGTLQAAVAVADAFLTSGTIVTIQGRHPESELVYHATSQDPSAGLPVIVLINDGSASASEIVAGAIADQGRGQLVGQTSFGKGSVQSIIPLNEGRGIKLTTAYYFTPEGHNIHNLGITPQHPVTPATDTEDTSLNQAFELLTTLQSSSN
jgi:carboxyl-terminal processing protease